MAEAKGNAALEERAAQGEMGNSQTREMGDAELPAMQTRSTRPSQSANQNTGQSLHPLVELTRTRLREFLREHEAVFWVFVFPVLLAFALGIAFRNTAPEKNSRRS